MKCKCGLNVRSTIDDYGDAGNWYLFPIESLQLGDTGHNMESIYFRIGPLVCQQGTIYNDLKLVIQS